MSWRSSLKGCWIKTLKQESPSRKLRWLGNYRFYTWELHVCATSWCYYCITILLQLHLWVTEDGSNPLPLEEEHCTAVEVTEEEVQNSVKLITSLSAVVSRLPLPLWSLRNTLKKYLSYVIYVSLFQMIPLRPFFSKSHLLCQVRGNTSSEVILTFTISHLQSTKPLHSELKM